MNNELLERPSTNKLAKGFFLGGNATFTVVSGKTGKHYTFRIRKPKATDRFPNPCFIVSVMTGSDNEAHFTYMGKLEPMFGIIKPTMNSKIRPGDIRWTACEWALGKVWSGEEIKGESKIMHEGRCGCCGKKLTNPESLSAGIGPECIKKFGGSL